MSHRYNPRRRTRLPVYLFVGRRNPYRSAARLIDLSFGSWGNNRVVAEKRYFRVLDIQKCKPARLRNISTGSNHVKVFFPKDIQCIQEALLSHPKAAITRKRTNFEARVNERRGICWAARQLIIPGGWFPIFIEWIT